MRHLILCKCARFAIAQLFAIPSRVDEWAGAWRDSEAIADPVLRAVCIVLLTKTGVRSPRLKEWGPDVPPSIRHWKHNFSGQSVAVPCTDACSTFSNATVGLGSVAYAFCGRPKAAASRSCRRARDLFAPLLLVPPPLS